MKVLFGILLGMIIVLCLLYGSKKVINPYYTLTIPKFLTDTTKKKYLQEDLIEIKNQTLTIEEKFASVNKRLDDMLVFGGIILTLILAINIGVFVNSERQVDKHMKDNFEIHKNKVLNTLSDVEKTAGRIKAELDIAQDLRKKFEQPEKINVPS
ncbi:MAG: hypothetical protein ACOYVG_07260 [Bacteroidota bacterium]